MDRPPTTPTPWRRAVHLGSGAVWLHQGLWCKVLRRDGAHHDVLAALPGPVGRHATALATGIGLAESALTVVVAVGGGRRSIAAVQTGLIIVFNAGGVVLARSQIERPACLLGRNALLVGAIWAAADRRRS